MANFNIAIKKTLESEGGLSDNPNDSGKLTKFGISQKAYPDEDIANLTIERAIFLYKRDYWDKIKGDIIYSQSMAESLFDIAVNGGVVTAIKMAQTVLGITADGIIGPITIKSLNLADPELFLYKFAVTKIENYIDICKRKPSNRDFFFGWVIRAIKDLPK